MRAVSPPTTRHRRASAVLGLGLLLAALTPASGQLSVGVSAGGATYLGDLAPASPIGHLSGLGPTYGAFARVALGELFALRGFVQHSTVRGGDATRPATASRNLSFESSIHEAGLLLEVGYRWSVLRPYGFAGGSVYRFNPTTEYAGETVELQALGTEGQGSPGHPAPYGLTRLALPLGAGLEVALDEQLSVGIEVSARATFFDHLDDVSGAYAPAEALGGPQAALRRSLADRRTPSPDGRGLFTGGMRGDPTDNDWFNLATLTVAYTLKLPERGQRSDEPPCYTF